MEGLGRLVQAKELDLILRVCRSHVGLALGSRPKGTAVDSGKVAGACQSQAKN